MDEFAMGSSNENSFFGAVSNPWGSTHVPGGSSGGSAAAVAAGLVAGATGTDTGGSIRQPAALCGITGLKPTYGRVSRYGMIAFASSLDQAGPMTRNAEDAALMLGVMAGFDEKDSTSANRTDDWLTEWLANGIQHLERPLTIGLPEEYFQDGEHLAAISAAQTELEKLGHKLVRISLPHTEAAIPVYYVLASAEASTNLSRYDGVRFGHRCENPKSLQDLYERSREEGFGQEVKRRILTHLYSVSRVF
jgi:aspartyl-tRNA(Asn)/glutamyl-tRNA(Gln) amidotransferase subunit A